MSAALCMSKIRPGIHARGFFLLGRHSFRPTWRCWGDRHLHGGGPRAARTGDLARAVFLHIENRKVDIAGITVHRISHWMEQMARIVTMEGCGALRDCRYLLHDRDTKFTQSFRAIIASGRVEPLVLPARSPN